MEETKMTETAVVEMTEMAVAGMTEMAAAGMTETAAEGMAEIACQRGHWPISSVSETRIIWILQCSQIMSPLTPSLI
jgi:hypothetical protein